MEKKKHFIKVFFTDNEEGFVCNIDGTVTEVESSIDQLRMEIGTDIHCEIDEDIERQREGVYGYRIDYTLTPIFTDPYN